MSTPKTPKQTLEEAIMESADWSGSGQICTKCTQGDLERALEPIHRALIKLRRCAAAKAARVALRAFLEADQVIEERVFKEHVSKAARTLYGLASSESPGSKHSGAVYEFLKKNLAPIATSLEGAKSSRTKRVGKRLRKIYEKRSSEPPMTRAQKIQWGFIPWKKMTRKERAQCSLPSRSHTVTRMSSFC